MRFAEGIRKLQIHCEESHNLLIETTDLVKEVAAVSTGKAGIGTTNMVKHGKFRPQWNLLKVSLAVTNLYRKA